MKPKSSSLKRSTNQKPLARSIYYKKRTQITNIKNESWGITIDIMNIKSIIKEEYEQLCAHKFDNLGEVDKFLKNTTF